MEEEDAREYSSDSEDEAPINIVGNIPLEWYDEFDHIGWTASGEKVIPKERPNAIDEMIRRSTDPDWWRRIYDKLSGEFRTITPEDFEMIERIRSGKVALKDYELYLPWKEKEFPDKIHPVSNVMKSKAAFQPPRSDIVRIMKIQAAIRRGEMEKEESESDDEAIDIWSGEYQVRAQKRRGRRAPKEKPPTTDDSYHPESGPGRLFDVPGYDKFLKERFDRCQDLYLCPREMRVRVPDTAAELLPELPDLEELKPYPTAECVRFVGHTGRVRSVDINSTGALLVSGGGEGVVKVWELQTGWCIKTFNLAEMAGNEAEVASVSFCKGNKSLIAACCGNRAFVIRLREQDGELPPEGENVTHVNENIAMIKSSRVNKYRQCTFSPNGTFLALLGESKLVYIYNTNTWDFRTPITSAKSYIQCVQFHPSKPRFFVATQHHILLYDLVERAKILQLRPLVKWISSIDVHPRGDHVIAGSFDGRGFWFDTELQVEPFKVLRNHSGAVRDVAYSRRFPLFATASDDTKIDVWHGAVFDDLVTNPRIVPVKELSGHVNNGILGVLAIVWHPTQPWLISAGADHSIRLWC